MGRKLRREYLKKNPSIEYKICRRAPMCVEHSMVLKLGISSKLLIVSSDNRIVCMWFSNFWELPISVVQLQFDLNISKYNFILPSWLKSVDDTFGRTIRKKLSLSNWLFVSPPYTCTYEICFRNMKMPNQSQQFCDNVSARLRLTDKSWRDIYSS